MLYLLTLPPNGIIIVALQVFGMLSGNLEPPLFHEAARIQDQQTNRDSAVYLTSGYASHG